MSHPREGRASSPPARTAPVTAGLNENQVRRILATFSYVDDLLRQAEALCREDPSPFAKERPDLSQEEAGLLLSFVTLARKRMLAALDRLGISRPEQSLSARRSVTTGLLFGEIALSELDARSLRGYGAVDAAAGEEITALADDLRALMLRGIALLKEHEEGGLADEIAALPGPAGEVLRTLLAVSTAHGLTEVRPLIAAAAERARSTTLDVGVFGRVSAGKSSLINALVGEPVLPVGATPVTAVPLRIVRGPHSAEVRFRDGKVDEVPLAELAAFATEEKNPRNSRGVRSIEVSVPGAPEGLRLLDTPGVGSLNASGSAQAFAWLPRCDLGLVLVAAGTPFGRDETALISGLRHAGIDCRALLSKADLLDDADRERALAYVAGELAPVLGPDGRVEVRAVSTRPGTTEGLDLLRAELLVPLAHDHVRRATQALQERLRRLVALTAASLDGGAPASDSGAIEFEKERRAAVAVLGRTTDALAGSAARVLEEVEARVAACWARGEDGASAARSAILAAAGRALAAVREAVDRLRSGAADEVEAEARRLPPLFDPEFLDAIRSLPPPRLRGLATRWRARNACSPLLPFLDESLHRYASRLTAWGEGALGELRSLREPRGPAGSLPAELGGLDALIAQVGAAAEARRRSARETSSPQGA